MNWFYLRMEEIENEIVYDKDKSRMRKNVV